MYPRYYKAEVSVLKISFLWFTRKLLKFTMMSSVLWKFIKFHNIIAFGLDWRRQYGVTALYNMKIKTWKMQDIADLLIWFKIIFFWNISYLLLSVLIKLHNALNYSGIGSIWTFNTYLSYVLLQSYLTVYTVYIQLSAFLWTPNTM